MENDILNLLKEEEINLRQEITRLETDLYNVRHKIKIVKARPNQRRLLWQAQQQANTTKDKMDKIYNLRCNGMKFVEIGKLLAISGGFAGELYARKCRKLRQQNEESFA